MRVVYIGLFLAFSDIRIANGYLTNVALFKEARQSSIEGAESTFQAGKAVDGLYPPSYSFSHTLGQMEPFWEVDLADTYIIANIKIYNRYDCCAERLFDVHVDVSTDHVTYTQFGYHPGIVGATYVFHTQISVNVGRWVRVLLGGGLQILQLAEVEVMSSMTYDYEYLKKEHGARGTGNVLVAKTVFSLSQCVFLCQQMENCHSVNIRQDLTSSTEVECQLLDNVTQEASSDPNITFWTMATVI